MKIGECKMAVRWLSAGERFFPSFILHFSFSITHYSFLPCFIAAKLLRKKRSTENWKMTNGGTAITMRPGVIGSISQ